MKLFDRFIASIRSNRGDSCKELRVRIRNGDHGAFVYIEEWFLGDKEFPRQLDESICLAPVEALSLAALLQTAVAAIKQEGGDG